MIYLKLFWAFLQVGLFSVGGGYAALPLIKDKVVDTYGWLNITEYADIVAISQMTPGPISINAATFVGTRIAGLLGAVIATLGCILPSNIIVILIAIFYKNSKDNLYVQGVFNGLRPAVVGLIASAGLSIILLSLWNGETKVYNIINVDFIALIFIAVCLLILRKTRINPTFVMIGAGVIGGFIFNLV